MYYSLYLEEQINSICFSLIKFMLIKRGRGRIQFANPRSTSLSFLLFLCLQINIPRVLLLFRKWRTFSVDENAPTSSSSSSSIVFRALPLCFTPYLTPTLPHARAAAVTHGPSHCRIPLQREREGGGCDVAFCPVPDVPF